MKNKVLIVDDALINRDILKEILKDTYDILEAEDGKTALEILDAENNEISAILLDLLMPVMDGFQVLEELNARKLIEKIPVLVISGENSTQNEQRCFELGIADFIGKPFNAHLVRKRVQNAAEHYAYRNELEAKVKEQTNVLRKAYRTLKNQAEQLMRRNQDIIEILGTVVEYRNMESGEHVKRVGEYTRILAETFMVEYPEYGLTQDKINVIVSASALHDIGKITIPDSILLKPGRLTKEEFEYMKSHTTRGCELLESMKNVLDTQYKKVSYEICRHHHERFDGKGYPDGLAGDAIPLPAQLVSVADVYDALVNERCYKDAFSPEEAFHMIVNGECGVFSPRLMEVFRKVRPEFEKLAIAK
mgnify:FL=1